MTYDVAVVGSPFLDLTFEALPRTPLVGEELLAKDLHSTPGGTAIQAIGAARLGLSAALISPIGSDLAGGSIREALEREGVDWIGPAAQRTPTTAVLSSPGGTAMATYLPEDELGADVVTSVDTRALVLSLGRLGLAPSGARTYVVTGSLEGQRADVRDALRGTRAFIANEAEATGLAGVSDASEAARALASATGTAVVTRGAIGAVAASGGELADASAVAVETMDATGAGDLFVAAYVWADLAGLDLGTRLRWATLAAGLSVREPTALAGAVRLDELLAAGRSIGLTTP